MDLESTVKLVEGDRMLLTRERFESRFQILLERSDRVDIASAWISDNNRALDLLEEKANSPGSSQLTIRVLVGIWGNGTSPKALHRLHEISCLRIVEVGRLFHPKVVIFKGRQGQGHAWVGSANFTRNGFAVNEEVMLETSQIQEIAEWFDHRWAEIGPQPGIATRIKEYECSYKPPRKSDDVELESERRWELRAFSLDRSRTFHANAMRAIMWSLYTAGRACDSAQTQAHVEKLLTEEYIDGTGGYGRNKNGGLIWRHRVRAAHETLRKNHIVRGSEEVRRGVWELTDLGRSSTESKFL